MGFAADGLGPLLLEFFETEIRPMTKTVKYPEPLLRFLKARILLIELVLVKLLTTL